MKIGDKVQVVDKPISLLQSHANMFGIVVRHGFGNEWLVKLNGELWWAKEYDIEVVYEDFFNSRYTFLS